MRNLTLSMLLRGNRFVLPSLLAICAFVSLTGCNAAKVDSGEDEASSSPPWFVDVTKSVGLDFVHDPGLTDSSYFLPQIIGSGGAFFDLDGDGLLDIYLIQNGGPAGARNRLFRQRADGKFEDISAGSGLDVAGYGMGVAIADVDNDGLPDVYLTAYGGNRLFLNQGKGRFREVTREAGVDNLLWGTSTSFLDFDRDGWLDLVVVNYLDLVAHQGCTDAASQRDYCHPSTFAGTVTRLYRNRGRDANGKWLGFEERTGAAGLATTPGPGLGVLCADFNGDGWPDIFVANDAKANHLWINQQNGTFKEEAVSRGVAFDALGQVRGNMGIAYGDIDGDGLPDLFVTHLSSENHGLWRQGPRGTFLERIAESGLSAGLWRATGFGTILGDFDNDGSLDLAIVSGAVTRNGPPGEDYWKPYAERNQLFANDGRGKFRDISPHNPEFCAKASVSRGLAVGDFNGDGGLDLLVTRIGESARLFRNVARDRGHWLKVRALEKIAPRDAIGAEIYVLTGTQRRHRLVQSGGSYLTSHDPQVHFGLGKVTSFDEILVHWPDGSREIFPGGAVDRVVIVRKGEGISKPSTQVKP